MGPSDKPLYIIGSGLTALLVIVGFNNFLAIQDKHHQGQPETGYTLPKPEAPSVQAANGDAAPTLAAAGSGDLATLVAAGDVAKGKKLFKRCGACHTADKGGPAKMGPNLYGIVGRDIASHTDFSGYSDALKTKAGTWTLEELSAFIANPKKAVPGTGMLFPGVKKDDKRADLLAYIKTLSD